MSEMVMVEQRTNGLDTSSVWIREGDVRLEGLDSDARLAELRSGLRRHFGVRTVGAAAGDEEVERALAALHGPDHMAALDAAGEEATVLPDLAPPGLEPDIPPSGPPCDAEVPRRVRFVVPGAGRDIVFIQNEVQHNPPLSDGLFQLLPLPGMRVRRSSCGGEGAQ